MNQYNNFPRIPEENVTEVLHDNKNKLSVMKKGGNGNKISFFHKFKTISIKCNKTEYSLTFY